MTHAESARIAAIRSIIDRLMTQRLALEHERQDVELLAASVAAIAYWQRKLEQIQKLGGRAASTAR